jgi:hypothetical protein
LIASPLLATTSLPNGVRAGAQLPRVRSAPPYVSTLGDEAADLMAEVGKPMFPWQAEFGRDALGRRTDGKWSSYESGLFVARQNGKGVDIEALELYFLFILQTRRVIHSAHLFDTSREAFQRLMDIIDGSDWLTRRVAQVNRAHGKEGITLTRAAGGGSLLYKARTLHGGRGFSGEAIFLDEAYALTAGHMAAISPILATLPNPWIGYFSSPPDDKTGPMPEDAWLPSVRKRGIAGAPRLTYWEFSPKKGDDPRDLDVIYANNPSAGYLIQEEYFLDQLRAFVAAGKVKNFATEHCGAWPDDADKQWLVIPEADWLDAEDTTSTALDPVAMAAVVSKDQGWVSIVAAGARADGRHHVELIARIGIGDALARITTLTERWKPCAWVIDKGGPSKSLAESVELSGIAVTAPTMRDVGGAAGALYVGVAGRPQPDPDTGELGGDPRTIRWRAASPELRTALCDAVAAADKRTLGAAWAWDQLGAPVDIGPVIGAGNALWGYLNRPPPVVSNPMFAFA